MAAVRGVRIYNGKIRVEVEEEVRAEHEQLKAQGVEFIYPRHPDFPPHLLEIAPMLFIKGQRKLLTSDGVAIVGSRNVSETGIRVARGLAAELANAGLNVVSGYAKGVDSEAHLGALATEGTTTIVLPYGIKELRQKSVFSEFDWQRDVLAVSQFDPGVKWLARNAMARNKLVCALSKAAVVIESGPERDSQGKMSGTFNTAQTALSMNLPLFVLDPKGFDNPPKGNAGLIDLGGECFDPDGGAEAIVKSISAAKTELPPVEKQDSPEQLEISF
jgi:DNA processing protein